MEWSVTSWAILCSGYFLLGVALIYTTNYAFPNDIWKWRFREVEGQDHVGPLLESIMLFLSAILLFVTGGLLYKESAQHIFNQYILAWPGLIGVLALLAFDAIFCFYSTPKSLQEDFDSGVLAKTYPKFIGMSQEHWKERPFEPIDWHWEGKVPTDYPSYSLLSEFALRTDAEKKYKRVYSRHPNHL